MVWPSALAELDEVLALEGLVQLDACLCLLAITFLLLGLVRPGRVADE